MKTRFSTLDLLVEVKELQRSCLNWRVHQIYDLDNKTYLIKLNSSNASQQPTNSSKEISTNTKDSELDGEQQREGVEDEKKRVLMFESGMRICTTRYEWARHRGGGGNKNAAPQNLPPPSGFTMKLRKHITNKRITNIAQEGVDRVLRITFGAGLAAYHLIIEFYDKGNIILVDSEMKIVNVLRPRTIAIAPNMSQIDHQSNESGTTVSLRVRETYSTMSKNSLVENRDEREDGDVVDKIVDVHTLTSELQLKLGVTNKKQPLKRILLSHYKYGLALLEHFLILKNINPNSKVFKNEDAVKHVCDVFVKEILPESDRFVETFEPSGYIITQEGPKSNEEGDDDMIVTYLEFQPHLFKQYEEKSYLKFASFDMAVDEFFSNIQSQKDEQKVLQMEKQVVKKLENVRLDHSRRIENLRNIQDKSMRQAEIVCLNEKMIEGALKVFRSALSRKMDWDDINDMIEDAREMGDPIAERIVSTKFEKNCFVMKLCNSMSTSHFGLQSATDYSDTENEDRESDELENEEGVEEEGIEVEINIGLTAHANARNLFTKMKANHIKEEKTVQASQHALKSVEKSTKSTLKEISLLTQINKIRKVFWFEKFYWFISTEGFLVIGGRDVQQNELIVKRYMSPSDYYVHADLHGASSVIIKVPVSSDKVPGPKTLNEAGQMAVCYSVAWDAKILAEAWWVHSKQVSKTAPSGEYLPAGSFIIRGKKNFLVPSALILGFGFMFKLSDDDSIARHKAIKCQTSPPEDLSRGATSEENVALVETSAEMTDADLDNNYSLLTLTSKGISKKLRNNKLLMPSNQQKQSKKDNQHPTDGVKMSTTSNTTTAPGDRSNVPRGKKGKMKKMKSKYKDQDDEEREIKMELLQGIKARESIKNLAQPSKTPEQTNANSTSVKESENASLNGVEAPRENILQTGENVSKCGNFEEKKNENIDVDDIGVSSSISTELDMLECFTGNPLPEDELAFALPVIAPYSTISSGSSSSSVSSTGPGGVSGRGAAEFYKFKVKLTPGDGKRGKAIKTTLNMFLHQEKSATSREKDLIKAVKEQDIAQNFPGKVKLSAPNLQKVKNKSNKK